MEDEPDDRRDWKDVRDWANVIVAACALIVSIVSLWTTAQVSGVQDYLQSEIKRRNNELDGISNRSRNLERIADDRSDRLSELQAATDAITASSIDAQKRYLSAQADLSQVRAEISTARYGLIEAKGQSALLGKQMEEQSRNFDLFSRMQARESASLFVTIQTLDGDDPPSGSKVIKAINGLSAPSGQALLQPYFDRIKQRIPLVCPSLASWSVTLAKEATSPPRPTIKYRRGTPKSEINRLTNEAQSKWMNDLNQSYEINRDRINNSLEASNRLSDLTRDCICQALADQRFNEQQICPLSR